MNWWPKKVDEYLAVINSDLRHIITREWVFIDPQKIKVVLDWPKPKIAKQLHGFLGLTGYHKKFV
jgi:hypothetical protein